MRSRDAYLAAPGRTGGSMEGSHPGIDIGAVFQGRYEILHKLSEGGFGVVYKARQLTTGQPVAIKCLRPPSRGVDPATYLERFRREMQLCAQLHHPNIVRLIDSGEGPGQGQDALLYSVFEYIPGKDLARVLATEGRIAPQQAKHILGQVLDALSCAHALGIVHRDLKPGNIMVAHTGARRNALVLDFGIAALVTAAQDREHLTLTSPMDRVGTPAYAAPEQLRGKRATAQADLYAWGLVFLECLTGARVIDGESIPDVIYRQLDPTPVPIPSALAGHPLGRLLRLVTAKDVAERQVSAVQALRMLEACDVSDLDLSGSGPHTPVGLESAVTGIRTSAPHGFSPTGNGPGSGSGSEAGGDVDDAATTNFAGTAAAGPKIDNGDVIDEIDDMPTTRLPALPEGERRQITALTCSLHLVTSSANAMDIDEQAELLSEYKELCRARIRAAGGHVASTLGHRLDAFYGYPRAGADDAYRAVQTGLGVLRELATRSAALDQERGIRVEVHIGAHTGLVLVRGRASGMDVGDVFGDVPAVAGQLCDGASPNTFVVSAATRRLVRNAFTFGRGKMRQIDGQSRPVEALEVEGLQRTDTTPGAVPGSGPQAQALVLVGRGEELGLLERRWRLAREGNGQTVLITGEAGIGKSRLARELALQVDEAEHLWLECRCMEDARNTALRPIVDLLERRLGFHMQLSPADRAQRVEALLARYRVEPAELMPLLAPLLSVPLDPRFEPVQASPPRQRELTLRAILSLLVEIAGHKPLVLLIEDLHWADPSTLELLSRLLETVPTAPMCVLLTARPELEVPWRHVPVTRVELGRLSAGSARAMMDRVTGGRVLPEEVCEQVLRRTDGVPLFIEELTRTIIESDVVRLEGDRYLLTGPLAELAIPSTLRDSLMARLDLLDPAAKSTAQLAAALGREFAQTQLRAISPLDGDRLQAALDALVQAELLHRRRGISGTTYMFRHSLVQETAYDSLPKRSRKQYHRRIVQALEERFPELAEARPELLMHHHARAEDLPRALDYARRAARAALRRSANAEAIAHAKQALGWLPSIEDAPRRAEVELSLNAVLSSAMMANYGYSSPAFRALMERSRELLDMVGESENAFVAFWGLFAYHFARAQHEQAGAVADRYLERAERAGDVGQQVNAQVLVGINRYYRACLGESRVHLERAISLFDPEVHRDHPLRFGYDTRCLAEGYLGLVLWTQGHPAQGRLHGARALARAEEINHPLSQILALFLLAKIDQLEGRRELVQGHTRRILDIAERTGQPRWTTVGELLESWTESDAPRGEQALSRFDESGHLLRRTYWSALIAESEAAAGHMDQAIARLRACERMVEGTGERSHLPKVLRLEGMLLALQGDAAGAEARLREAMEAARVQGAKTFELQAVVALSRVLIEGGRRGEARALLADIVAWFSDEDRDAPPLAEARALLHALQG